jgi:ribosomal-protein-alanine N-acetyltransferase
MMDIKIIKAGTEHINDIYIIENLSFAIPWSKQALYEEIVENDKAIYLAAKLDGGKVIGYIGMWKILDEGHITNISVHPEFRRNGVGSALMSSLIEISREAGIMSITLEVRKSNLAARALYAKFGFKESGLRKAYYADNNEDAIIMWRNE